MNLHSLTLVLLCLKVFLPLPTNHNHLYPRSIILTQNTHSVIYIKFAYITQKVFLHHAHNYNWHTNKILGRKKSSIHLLFLFVHRLDFSFRQQDNVFNQTTIRLKNLFSLCIVLPSIVRISYANQTAYYYLEMEQNLSNMAIKNVG